MEIDIGELYVRLLRNLSDDTPRNRILWTIGLFMREDERVADLLREIKTFDADLFEEIASLASPIELAQMIEEIGPYMPHDCFVRLFQRAIQSTTDIRGLRPLASAAAWYWHVDPKAIEFPYSLVEGLLDSSDEDAQLVGLKVLRRFYPEPSGLYHRIRQALSSRSCVVRCGGTHELSQCLDDPSHRFLLGLAAEQVGVVRGRIDDIVRNEYDYCTRENAENCKKLFGYYDERVAAASN